MSNRSTVLRSGILGFSSLVLLGSTTSLQAQMTDFSGTWVFKNQESISGKLYSNGNPKQISVVQKPDAVTIEQITAKGDGTDATVSETVSLDGKAFERETASKKKVVVTIKVSDDQKQFTKTSNIYSATDSAKMVFRTTDDFSLSADGKELILVRKTENFTNGETWQARAWYDKQ